MINLFGYLLFAFITSITPGPNNLLLLGYGKKYGLKGVFGIMVGIASGFLVLLYLSGYGVGQILNANEMIAISFKIVSSIWLLYLAFVLSKIHLVNASSSIADVGFVQAFLMQFLNPKAWLMAINGAAVFMPTFKSIHLNVLVYASIFLLVGIPCMVVWVVLGDIMSRFWASEKANKIIGYVLSLLMLLSIASIWF